jgi:hypothetical protein
MKKYFLIGLMIVLISLLCNNIEVSAKPAVYEPSNQPLLIQDLEDAIFSTADPQDWDFHLSFWGGYESQVFAGDVDLGILSSNPLYPFWDAVSSDFTIPFIIQPTVDEINPILSHGDTVTITYDGGLVLTVYLPYMDGTKVWDNLFVATDGSTYYHYDPETETLVGPAATAPFDKIVANPHPNEKANYRAFLGKYNSLKNVPVASDQPLLVQDIEDAEITMAEEPDKTFKINFWGGTDSKTYAGDVSFGEIPGVKPIYPFWDDDASASPIPLIVQPAVDEMNPVMSYGDTITITYDGSNILTVYLPYMDDALEWDNLFVATDGSTYYHYDSATGTLVGPAALAP